MGIYQLIFNHCTFLEYICLIEFLQILIYVIKYIIKLFFLRWLGGGGGLDPAKPSLRFFGVFE